jgi:SSS family transporter
MSIIASFTSAISILGFAMEIYRFGGMYLVYGLSYFSSQSIACYVFVPFFHNLKITSAYQYLEMRFNKYVKSLASLTFCIQMFLYMSVTLLAPSLAIQQVMKIPLWVSISFSGLICTFYTSFGGIKAVIWTDTFQILVMFGGLITIIIFGTLKVGGLSEIYELAKESGRLDFFDFNPSLTQRHTFWSLIIGGTFTSLTVYASNQATIQRYITLPTVKDAQKAMYINLIGTLSVLFICCSCGYVAYAHYVSCDPFLAGQIKQYDQVTYSFRENLVLKSFLKFIYLFKDFTIFSNGFV